MWDDNQSNELYILDVDGVEEYLPNLNNVEKARDFWKYNKSEKLLECFLFIIF